MVSEDNKILSVICNVSYYFVKLDQG